MTTRSVCLLSPSSALPRRQGILIKQNPHPIAAIVALVDQMEASTAETTTGLAREMQAASNRLKSTQKSLGVRAGCQLWANFFSDSTLSSHQFEHYKRNLIEQGRAFCNVTAAQCREDIADLAVDFLKDDCTVSRKSRLRCYGIKMRTCCEWVFAVCCGYLSRASRILGGLNVSS